jgi:DNA-binding NarL/FixJ family response regulator
VKVFVLDAHQIYRRGLTSCLETADGIDGVGDAGSVAEAWQHPGLQEADVVVLDHAVSGGLEFIRNVREATGARVLVCASGDDEGEVVAVVAAGSMGYVSKDALTPESLIAWSSTTTSASWRSGCCQASATLPASATPAIPSALSRQEVSPRR